MLHPCTPAQQSSRPCRDVQSRAKAEQRRAIAADFRQPVNVLEGEDAGGNRRAGAKMICSAPAPCPDWQSRT
ncbi:MAG: hypothetical protein ACTHMR_00655 [Thermomicrobiales bacterium]